MKRIIFLFAAFALATPVHAQSDLEDGFAGALRGCEEWILDPASWAQGSGPFVAAVGLGDKMGLVNQIDEASLPSKELRRGNHYWRINSTEKAGYVLVVSDQLPMCHITGGGGRSEEHTSELQSLMRISYVVFCLQLKKNKKIRPCHSHP